MKPAYFLPLLFVPAIPALQRSHAGTAAGTLLPAAELEASLAWGDVDGDGLDDVLVIDASAHARLLMHFGEGRFEDVTLACGLGEQPGATCALLADLDGDGHDDLYLGSGETRVWRNLGNGTFQALASGIEHDLVDLDVQAVDRDEDGRPDLEIHTEAGELVYRNLGAGRFERLDLPQTLGGAPVAWSTPTTPALPGKDAAGAGTPAEQRLERWSRARALGLAPGASRSPLPGISTFSELTCLPGVRDAAGGACLGASSVPELGKLYPLSTKFFVDDDSGSWTNIGMGTTSPHAIGVLTLRANNVFGDMIYMRDQADTNQWHMTLSNGGLEFVQTGVANGRLFLAAGGNVGIGTTTPGKRLVVNGEIIMGDATTAEQDINVLSAHGDWEVGSNDSGNGTSGNQFYIYDSNTSTYGLTVQRGTGNVGIGTNAPTQTLSVNGTAGKPGGGTWSTFSDARLKQNVHDLEGALETLLALHGVTFEYKDPEAIHELPGTRTGFIAQEVEQVIPDWVDEVGEYKCLTIRGFEALAVEALRELTQQCADKDAGIAALEARVERLESMEAELSALRETLAALAR